MEYEKELTLKEMVKKHADLLELNCFCAPSRRNCNADLHQGATFDDIIDAWIAKRRVCANDFLFERIVSIDYTIDDDGEAYMQVICLQKNDGRGVLHTVSPADIKII